MCSAPPQNPATHPDSLFETRTEYSSRFYPSTTYSTKTPDKSISMAKVCPPRPAGYTQSGWPFKLDTCKGGCAGCDARAQSAVEGGAEYVCNRYYGSDPTCDCTYPGFNVTTACSGLINYSVSYSFGGKLKIYCDSYSVTKTKNIWFDITVNTKTWKSTVNNYGTYTV